MTKHESAILARGLKSLLDDEAVLFVLADMSTKTLAAMMQAKTDDERRTAQAEARAVANLKQRLESWADIVKPNGDPING